MVKHTESIEVIDKPADRCALSTAALDLVVGGRMKLPGPVPTGAPYGQGAGLPFGEWSLHLNYLPF
jgi:hypothetical protein